MRTVILSLAFMALSACGSTMKTEDFQSFTPHLKIEDYFHGKTIAYGLFEDRFGKVRNQFSVEINGNWNGKTLILDEDFIYIDGTTENRRWVIEKTGPDTYRGTTDQAIGDAIGKSAGNSFHWTYKFNLKVDDDIWKVGFDDWMFLQQDGVLINKARVSRWGIHIGTVYLSFHKATPRMALQAAAE